MSPSALWQENKAAVAAAVAGLLVLLSCVTIVPENEQAVIVRVGEPVRVINRFRPGADFGSTGAGLIFRVPIVERLVRIDKRVLSVDMDRQQVLSTDQQRIEVDAYARFRIIDPVRMSGPQGRPSAWPNSSSRSSPRSCARNWASAPSSRCSPPSGARR